MLFSDIALWKTSFHLPATWFWIIYNIYRISCCILGLTITLIIFFFFWVTFFCRMIGSLSIFQLMNVHFLLFFVLKLSFPLNFYLFSSPFGNRKFFMGMCQSDWAQFFGNIWETFPDLVSCRDWFQLFLVIAFFLFRIFI